MKRYCLIFTFALAVAATSSAALTASAQTPGNNYFAGKTVKIGVGFAAGGAAGVGTQIVARWLSKTIPGQPNVVVDFKPGAGGRILTNYMYNLSPPNGLEMARVDSGTATGALLNDPAVQFDATKFNWLGALTSDGWMLTMRSATGVNSLETLKKAQKRPSIGSISAVHKTFTNARLLEEILGVKFDMVTGYPGGNDINLALARGELDGAAVSYAGFMQRNVNLVKSGELAVIVQSGRGENHESLQGLTDVPVLWKLASADQLPLLRVATIPWDSPYIVAPKTPPEIVATLRRALETLAKDSEFIAEYKKGTGDDVEFTSGPRLQEDVETIQKSPPAAIEALKGLFVKK